MCVYNTYYLTSADAIVQQKAINLTLRRIINTIFVVKIKLFIFVHLSPYLIKAMHLISNL